MPVGSRYHRVMPRRKGVEKVNKHLGSLTPPKSKNVFHYHLCMHAKEAITKMHKNKSFIQRKMVNVSVDAS